MAEGQGCEVFFVLAFFKLPFPPPHGVDLYLADMLTSFCRSASSFLFTLVS